MSGNRYWIGIVFWLFITLGSIARACYSAAMVVWHYVPQVRWFGFRNVKQVLWLSLLRAPETHCPLDEAVHECNIALEGSCPADTTRSVVYGARLTCGPVMVTWPRA